MQSRNPSGSFLLRLDDDQREELNVLAQQESVPVQHYIELRIFGRIRPRAAGRPRKIRNQPTLPIEEEATPRKSA